MKKVSIRELQLILINAMKELHHFCEKFNIKYWLDSGSLLGAVREKKFIAWDDDIDICMLRDDYMKFIKYAPLHLNNNFFFVQTIETDENYTDYNIPCKLRLNDTKIIENNKKYKDNTIPRHYGFFIDILPCDYYPHNIYKRKIVQSIKHLFYGKSLYYRKDISLKASILSKLIHYTVPLSLLYKLHKAIISILDKNENNLISKGIELPFHSSLNLYEDIFPLKKIEFENIQLYAPNNSHVYLLNLYGPDYMTPPDKKDQISHSSEFYVADNKADILDTDLSKE